jgi:hypothetical protein
MNDTKAKDLARLKSLNNTPGSVVRVRCGYHRGDWIKLDPKAAMDGRELENCWVSLRTGEIRHYSWLADAVFPLVVVREGMA